MKRIPPERILRDLQLPRAVGQLQSKEHEKEVFLFTPFLEGRLLRKLAFDVPVSAIDSAQPWEHAQQPRIFVVYFKPELDSTLKDKVFVYSELFEALRARAHHPGSWPSSELEPGRGGEGCDERPELDEDDDAPASDEPPDWEESVRYESAGECPCCGAPPYWRDRDRCLPRSRIHTTSSKTTRRWTGTSKTRRR